MLIVKNVRSSSIEMAPHLRSSSRVGVEVSGGKCQVVRGERRQAGKLATESLQSSLSELEFHPERDI